MREKELITSREKLRQISNQISQLIHSEKEFKSNDTVIHFQEFSKVHNSNRRSNAILSSLSYKKV